MAEDVTEELLEAKIGEYVNFGVTTGPDEVLAALEGVCTSNFGAFHAVEKAEAAEAGDADAEEEA
jgi:hypothetical protein